MAARGITRVTHNMHEAVRLPGQRVEDWLARNTRAVIDEVVRTGQPLAVERKHVLVAHIGPAQPAMTVAQALAGLPPPMLDAAEGRRWLEDSRSGPDG